MPGIEKPGIPTWKSGMLPELICPEILAKTSNLAATLPPNTKSSANSLIFGGIIVPAATAPMPMDAWTLASRSRETDALGVIEIFPAFMGHLMFVWNRFFSPEKSTGVECETDLLNAPT